MAKPKKPDDQRLVRFSCAITPALRDFLKFPPPPHSTASQYAAWILDQERTRR